MKTPRIAVPVVGLAALAVAGCFLLSGQFVVDYELPSPLTVIGGSVAPAGVDVDLNTISDYHEHKADLKRVDDVALIGDFRNNSGSATDVEMWLVPSAAMGLSLVQLQSTGVRLWGPLAVSANGSEHVDWNHSARLFVGRQALTDEVKGDGHFALYVIASGTADVTLTKGALIAVVSAAK